MRRLLTLVALGVLGAAGSAAADVRVKDLGRFHGWRDNPLVGYGVVTGLSGSGDSPKNPVTRQALQNVLSRLGANVTAEQVQSRNVAAVVVTATLPASANVGDRVDVNVSSVGDARSLVGGTLLMTPLIGPDRRTYGLAQGPVVVGGHRFESHGTSEQRNYPTGAIVPEGGTVETAVGADLLGAEGELRFVLKDPDVTTAERIADGINAELGVAAASVREADMVAIRRPPAGADLYRLIARIENVRVDPDGLARVVVNERSGTVVAGAGVRISGVVLTQGDIKVSVKVERTLADPVYAYGPFAGDAGLQSVTNATVDVVNGHEDAVVSLPNTSVGDLVLALRKVRVDTRGVISILQAMKAAGALHAQIIVQ
jgi:flagellar P-ring protein precursor FlgI